MLERSCTVLAFLCMRPTMRVVAFFLHFISYQFAALILKALPRTGLLRSTIWGALFPTCTLK